MRYEIRQSANGKFYYLLEIDKDNNEKLIADSTNLDELKNHSKVSGKSVDVVKEADIRGTVQS